MYPVSYLSPHRRLAMWALCPLLLLGCSTHITGVDDGGGPGGDGGGGDGGSQMGSIIVSPPQASITVTASSGQPGTAKFTAKDTSGTDVTASASWHLGNPQLGSVASGLVTIPANAGSGGDTQVIAQQGAASGAATLHIKYIASDVIGPGAGANSPGQFGGPATGPALSVVYPLDGVMLARNINQMNIMWSGNAADQIYRITVDSTSYEQSFYVGTSACPANQCSFKVDDATWNHLTHSVAGGQATLTISGTAGTGQPVGSAPPLTLHFSPEDVKGGLYYFSTSRFGLLRLPFGETTTTPFLLGTGNPGDGVNRCVGCHAVSRDGKKVAAVFYQPDGVNGIVDGADPTKFLLQPKLVTSDQLWNFASFSPDGSKLITVWNGTLALRDGQSGGLVKFVGSDLLGGRASMPEWSPDGNSIVFVRVPAGGKLGSDFTSVNGGKYAAGDWILGNAGDIAVVPYNGGNFGMAVTVVASTPGSEYHFYPSFSPDSKWLVFNSASVKSCASDSAAAVTGLNVGEAQCVSYDQTAARLRLVQAMSGAVPIELTAATHIPLKTTAWPKFAPFQQGNLVFFTFSAKFDYGWVVQQAQVVKKDGLPRPQIWMSGIDLGKAAAGTGDPSYPPFWLPFQDPTTNNHEVLWTQDIACTKAADCGSSGAFDCVNGMCVPKLG